MINDLKGLFQPTVPTVLWFYHSIIKISFYQYIFLPILCSWHEFILFWSAPRSAHLFFCQMFHVPRDSTIDISLLFPGSIFFLIWRLCCWILQYWTVCKIIPLYINIMDHIYLLFIYVGLNSTKQLKWLCTGESLPICRGSDPSDGDK